MAPTILFVDDEPQLLDAQARLLGRKRPAWRIDTARGGADALARMDHAPASAAVIDLCMPDMNGVELAARMRRRWPATPTIMLTGNAQLSTVVEAINQGRIFAFHEKPCAIETLIQSIEAAMAPSAKSETENPGDFADAVDGWPIGMAMLDAGGRLLRANGAGRRLLAGKSCLLVDSGGILRAVSSACATPLAEAVAAAASGHGPFALSLRAHDDTDAVSVAIAPTRRNGAVAGVTVTIADCRAAPSAAALRSLFGLTPSEARLAQALAAGSSLEAAAHSISVSVGSARTYLKAIFQKTGVSRQAELVHQILTSAAAFVPEQRPSLAV